MNHSHRPRRLLAAALALALTGALARTATAEPAPSAPAPEREQYRIDFSRAFPSGQDAGEARLMEAVAELETLKGKAAASPANLLRALTLNDTVQRRLMPLYLHRYVRYLVDTSDSRSLDAAGDLFSSVGRRTGFLRQELLRLKERKLKRFLKREPRLAAYRFSLEDLRRDASHRLPPGGEEVASALGPLASGWQGELHQMTADAAPWGKVPTPEGELDVRLQGASLAAHPDRSVREAAFRRRHAALEEQREVQAFALSRLARARNRLARLRGFPDAPAQAQFDLYLDPADVERLVSELAARADLYKRFQRLGAERAARRLGLSEASVWDMGAPLPGVPMPRFTLPEAAAAVRESLAPLGAEYGRELAAVLDPANGRFDAAGGRRRANLSTGWGFPGAQPGILFLSNFQGFYADVDTLAHEAGHAVHFDLMGRSGVLPRYAEGPRYFTESFGMFNQLLLADYLVRRETDPGRRAYFMGQLVSRAMYPLAVAHPASLEEAIYRNVGQDGLLTADDLDRLALEDGKRWSIWPERHPELKHSWIETTHLYTHPQYVVNYVYAGLLALTYYERFNREPEKFVPEYLALMRNGFDAPPAELLRRFVGIDLHDPGLVARSAELLRRKVGDLERVYAEDSGPHGRERP